MRSEAVLVWVANCEVGQDRTCTRMFWQNRPNIGSETYVHNVSFSLPSTSKSIFKVNVQNCLVYFWPSNFVSSLGARRNDHKLL